MPMTSGGGCVKITGPAEKDNGAAPYTFFPPRSFFSNFAMDVIASVFFGTEVNSQRNPNSPFCKHAKTAFDVGLNSHVLALAAFLPVLSPLFQWLGFSIVPKADTDFFVKTVNEIILLRRRTKQVGSADTI